jgi:hypothetical protein
MSQKNKSRENPSEQQIFETLDRQARRFDEPVLSGHSPKRKYENSGGRVRPPKFTIEIKLKNGKAISGIGVSFDNPKMPKSKLFFSTGQRSVNGGLKDFCIPSHVDIRSQGGNIALVKDLNNFLEDVHEQARAEFPEWLEKWGCRANETNPFLNLDEIREEWRYKKNQFGIFRLAVRSGFFTDIRPLNAERLKIIGVEISNAQ